MTRLSVEYEGLVRDLTVPLVPAEVGNALLRAVAERYELVCPNCSLVQFTQSGAAYLFDIACAVGAEQEDRTVAAWTVAPDRRIKLDRADQFLIPVPVQRAKPGMCQDRSAPVNHQGIIPGDMTMYSHAADMAPASIVVSLAAPWRFRGSALCAVSQAASAETSRTCRCEGAAGLI